MTPNKYHPSGRLYTAKELAARAYDLLPRMVVPGYCQPDAGKQWLEAQLRPYNIGRNKTKRLKHEIARQRRAALMAATRG